MKIKTAIKSVEQATAALETTDRAAADMLYLKCKEVANAVVSAMIYPLKYDEMESVSAAVVIDKGLASTALMELCIVLDSMELHIPEVDEDKHALYSAVTDYIVRYGEVVK